MFNQVRFPLNCKSKAPATVIVSYLVAHKLYVEPEKKKRISRRHTLFVYILHHVSTKTIHMTDEDPAHSIVQSELSWELGNEEMGYKRCWSLWVSFFDDDDDNYRMSEKNPSSQSLYRFLLTVSVFSSHCEKFKETKKNTLKNVLLSKKFRKIVISFSENFPRIFKIGSKPGSKKHMLFMSSCWVFFENLKNFGKKIYKIVQVLLQDRWCTKWIASFIYSLLNYLDVVCFCVYAIVCKDKHTVVWRKISSV